MSEARDAIRKLTDDYFQGRIDRAKYRAARGRLLDELAGLPPAEKPDGEDTTVRMGRRSEPSDGQPPAEQPPQERSTPESPDGPEWRATPGDSVRPDAPSAAGRPRGVPVRAIAAGGAAIVLAVVVLLSWPGEEEDARPADGGGPAAAGGEPAEGVVPGAPDTPFMRDYLRSPTWDESGVAAFLFDWDLLTASQQDAVRESEAFRNFANALRDRIRTDRAIDDAALAPDAERLEGLAATLGVDLGMLAERDVPVAAEPVADDGAAAERVTGQPAPPTAEKPADEPAQPVADAPAEELRAAADALQKQTNAPATAPRPAKTPPVAQKRVMPESVAAGTAAASDAAPSRTDAGAAPVASAAGTGAEREPAVAETRSEVDAQSAGEPSADDRAQLESRQPCTAARLNTRSATCWDLLAEGVRGPLLRVLPAGEFVMGEAGDPAASPVRTREIDHPFAIGLREVSLGEFNIYCVETGARCPEPRWSGSDYPAVDVSWQEAVSYTNWLTARTGASYRLPTETEWEYAARAGTTTRYPFGDTLSPTAARFASGHGLVRPVPVDDRTTPENAWRLSHVIGNVREWTSDPWRANYEATEVDPDRRVIRGGSYADPAENLRSAFRESAAVSYFDAKTGFRVLRELPAAHEDTQ
jgi:formylglycine-generating enzyme required for sulfatase activity